MNSLATRGGSFPGNGVGFLKSRGLDVYAPRALLPGAGEGDSQDDELGQGCSQLNCTQDNFFCTPDFCTPADQQFTVEYDPSKGAHQGMQSPAPISPDRMRLKRPLSSVEEDDEDPFVPSSLSAEDVSQPPLPSATRKVAPLFTKNTPTGSSSQRTPIANQQTYIQPNSRRGLQLRTVVLSPECHTNPFLAESHARPPSRRPVLRPPLGSSSMGAPSTTSSRFKSDFQELGVLGSGSFGKVYKVVSRLDGCVYAIKKSSQRIRNAAERERKLQEVQALAAVGAHANIVRYHGCWIEADLLYMQTELCDSALSEQSEKVFSEGQIKEYLRQVGSALAHIHGLGIVHLDVKPENIFISKGTYKLGDFGHASPMDPTQNNFSVQEGDARYVPKELLNHDYNNLDRADMFALGAVAYELARGKTLCGNGPDYDSMRKKHYFKKAQEDEADQLTAHTPLSSKKKQTWGIIPEKVACVVQRKGKLTLLPTFSLPFQNLLKSLLHEDPVQRPSAQAMLELCVMRK